MSFTFDVDEFEQTPQEVLAQLVQRTREAREKAGLSRQALADRTGISMSTYKHFEETGQISLERLLIVAEALGCLSDFGQLFAPRITPKPSEFPSLDQVEQAFASKKPAKQRKPK
ncbi:helix-turn-helix domain-containing protein [Cerasicoccus fimbriatus]|uniref:helix-turn-helix domain-containing protein n=1 Tax=Cerasicoccus fimbriatus TaxID=3014554 RepID=UPI0022B2CEEB|nr:helix-turn-helix transcriptional regulator [Cerasicoccus sp. TK19100]